MSSSPTKHARKSDFGGRTSPTSTIASGSMNELDEAQLAYSLMTEKQKSARRRVAVIAFVCSIVNCLCAGSIVLFSMWAPSLQSRLGFSQMQINAIAIAGELGTYLSVPVFGAMCDRFGPAKLSVLAALLFGPAYLLAAYAYAEKLSFYVMLIAFWFIGCGTCSMYMSGVTTCAKNFTSNRRGIALALPIAAFGLSSLWESQVVGYFFSDDSMPGGIKIDAAYTFLAVLLGCAGLIGGLGLNVLPKLKDSDASDASDGDAATETTSLLRAERGDCYGIDGASEPQKNDSKDERILNEATRKFLRDRTMWWFAAGVFLVTGPGEVFINNMGTLTRSLYTPDVSQRDTVVHQPIDTATHVSIVAFMSTLARIIAGTLSDYLAPAAPVSGPREAAAPASVVQKKHFTMSRMWLLLGFSVIMCAAQCFVAAGGVDQKGEYFWIVSSAMGAGYGAVFALAPTIVSVVWGIDNFGTNWGIVAITPAIGATMFGLLFASIYDSAAQRQNNRHGITGLYNMGFDAVKSSAVETMSGGSGTVCYGLECYSTAFWVMAASVAVACVAWTWAWRGKGGWAQRGVSV